MTAPTTDDLAAELAKIADLDADALRALQVKIVEAFDAADAADDLAALTSLAGDLETVREAIVTKTVEAPATPPAPPVAPTASTPKTETTPPVETPAAAPPDAAPVATETPAAPEVVAEQPAAVETPAPAAEVVTITPATTPAAEVQEGLPVAASGTTVAVKEGAEPVLASGPTSRVFAGGGIPGYTAGVEFKDGDDFAKALAARINTLLRLNGGDGEQVVIASIKTDAPEDRVLDGGSWIQNMEKIRAITEPEAITAAGGCCAPLVTRYDLFDCGGVTDRPVRDALAGFRAERGGIRFWRGPALADLGGAIGFWTCADDTAADPATPATWKVCTRIDCPPEETAELQAVTMCITFGVIQSRVFPELVVANNKVAMVAQARIADSALLAQIKAGSVAITDSGTTLGAVRDLLDVVGRISMWYRDRYRIKTAPLRAIFPYWLLEALRGDIIKGPTEGTLAQHFGPTDGEIAALFAARGINVTWALDSSAPATNGGGFFADIVSPTPPAWPTTVQWALFTEGSWLFLDGGQLDLGVIRDSSLVRVNDYMTFAETFEAAVNIGCQSLWITSTIDVTGKAQGPIVG